MKVLHCTGLWGLLTLWNISSLNILHGCGGFTNIGCELSKHPKTSYRVVEFTNMWNHIVTLTSYGVVGVLLISDGKLVKPPQHLTWL